MKSQATANNDTAATKEKRSWRLSGGIPVPPDLQSGGSEYKDLQSSATPAVIVELNGRSSESHQTCLNGRVVTDKDEVKYDDTVDTAKDQIHRRQYTAEGGLVHGRHATRRHQLRPQDEGAPVQD